ncbi:hypothetical protein ABMA27_016969 [Loxostege sticticalis]|uniref:Reverse transcriptase domain-containing protein n=1 Tax=Loxostege sticticalis TaxID=481309 RepID=A0ABR3GYM1_LOXSC
MSDPYRLECGVRQGGLSSPSIFSLYINGLIEALNKQHIGCYIDGVCFNNISYADDMVLLSASVCGLRKLIKICESYAADHGLIYNSKKSHCMVFQGGCRKVTEMPPLLLNGIPMSRVDQFKYLGHLVTSTLKDDADIAHERRALSFYNAFRMLLGLPRFCSASTMFAEARVDCFYTTMRKRAASLVRRVRGHQQHAGCASGKARLSIH